MVDPKRSRFVSSPASIGRPVCNDPCAALAHRSLCETAPFCIRLSFPRTRPEPVLAKHGFEKKGAMFHSPPLRTLGTASATALTCVQKNATLSFLSLRFPFCPEPVLANHRRFFARRSRTAKEKGVKLSKRKETFATSSSSCKKTVHF
eukprot:COSAG06_NODE_4682_length_4037_cov_11.317166_6_plen_148_part_00